LGLTKDEQTKYLKGTKYGFAIPAGAVINGIVVEVRRHGEGEGVEDASVKLVKAGSVAGTDRAAAGAWPGSDATMVYGSPTDLWGTTWTVAQVNAEGFGAAISAKVDFLGVKPAVDVITITVYYTEESAMKWVTLGDAVDLTIISASHVAQRTEVSDANINSGRYAFVGAASYSNIIAGIKCKRSASAVGAGEEVRQAALIRAEGEGNWLMGCYDFVNTASPGEDTLRILKRIGGGEPEELIPKIAIPASSLGTAWRGVWIEANDQGRICLWAALTENATPELLAVIFDTDLATGGALAAGKAGFYDAKTGAVANTRQCDNFAAWIPNHDAVLFGGKVGRLTSDGLSRQSADGNGFGPVQHPDTDLPRIPVSGPEERPVEVALRPSRGDFAQVPDSGIDTLAVRLAYRPCWPYVPGL
jgi:hypothetical protein